MRIYSPNIYYFSLTAFETYPLRWVHAWMCVRNARARPFNPACCSRSERTDTSAASQRYYSIIPIFSLPVFLLRGREKERKCVCVCVCVSICLVGRRRRRRFVLFDADVYFKISTLPFDVIECVHACDCVYRCSVPKTVAAVIYLLLLLLLFSCLADVDDGSKMTKRFCRWYGSRETGGATRVAVVVAERNESNENNRLYEYMLANADAPVHAVTEREGAPPRNQEWMRGQYCSKHWEYEPCVQMQNMHSDIRINRIFGINANNNRNPEPQHCYNILCMLRYNTNVMMGLRFRYTALFSRKCKKCVFARVWTENAPNGSTRMHDPCSMHQCSIRVPVISKLPLLTQITSDIHVSQMFACGCTRSLTGEQLRYRCQSLLLVIYSGTSQRLFIFLIVFETSSSVCDDFSYS